MKAFKLIGLALFTILMCLSACSSGGDDPIEPTPKPEVPKSEITIDSSIISNGLSFSDAENEQTISFTTNENWTLNIANTTSGATWCTASTSSGTKGSTSVKFTVTENTTYDNRSVSVTIKAGTASKTFTISQKGVDALLVTTNKYEVSQEGGTIDIEVKANIDYKMEISEKAKNWIKESSNRALIANKHTLNIELNEEFEKREGEIYFRSGDKMETVKVYQTGGAILLLSQNECNVSDKGDTISVDIKSNIDFGVQMPDVDWIIDEASSRGLSSHTLKYIISANKEYDGRSASIVFFDKNSGLKDTLVVNQAQKDAIILSKKEISVASDAGTIEVKVASNVDFEVSMPDVDWIKRVGSRGLVDYALYFSIVENTGNEAREAIITFTNKANQLSESIKVIQKRKEVGLELPNGSEFNSIVGDFLTNNPNLNTIKFIANSVKTSDAILVTDKNNSIGYMIANGDCLEIHTSAKQFMANYYCGGMFAGKYKEYSPFNSLIEIDFGSNFNTSNVRNMNYMFSHCNNLLSLDFSNFDTSNVVDMGTMFQHCENLTHLNLETFDTSNVYSMHFMFAHCNKLESIELSNFDTSNVTNMSEMFYCCDSLNHVDVSNFNTSEVTTMEGMFFSCDNLTSIEVRNFETSNVTSMEDMFHGCRNITTLDLSNFDTSNVTDMGAMFAYCERLQSLNISSFNTSKVTSMRWMFEHCESLKTIDLHNFDTSNVTEMNLMFSGCNSLMLIDLQKFNTSKVTDMGWMFADCQSLVSLDLSYLDTSNVTNMNGLFTGCHNLLSIELGNLNTTNVIDMGQMFYSCFNLKSLDLTNFSFSKSPKVEYMFKDLGKTAVDRPIPVKVTDEGYNYLIKLAEDCNIGGFAKFVNPDGTDRKEQHIKLYLPDGHYFNKALTSSYEDEENITKIRFVTGSNSISEKIFYSDMNGAVAYLITNNEWLEIHTSAKEFVANKDCSMLFSTHILYGNTQYKFFERITEIDFGNSFNTENVKDMSSIFSGCTNLISLDISNFNTSNVTDISCMFADCRNLKSINLENLDTSKVTEIWSLFNGCHSLTSVSFGNFNTSNVTNMSWMFYNCLNLESVDLSSFDTQNVTDMTNMFGFCNKLETLNIASFNTKNVREMEGMFYYCRKLTSLDLSNFNTEKAKNMKNMFANCWYLNSLNLSGFSFVKNPIVDNMFVDLGIYASQVSEIKVDEKGYTYLTKNNCGLGSSAKFINIDGADW